MGEKNLHESEKNLGDFQDSGFPRRRPPWGIKDILVVLVLVYLAGFAFTSIGARFLDWVPLLVPGLNSREAVLFFAAGFVQALCFIGLVLFCVSGKYHTPPAALGLTRFSRRDILFTGVPGGLGISAVVTFLMSLISFLTHETPPPQPLTELLLNIRSWQSLLISFLLVGVLAPLGEEIYFRGFVYPALRSQLGVLPAVLISSSFFGALHFDLFRFLPLAVGGAALAVMCERTGSLFPSIAAHSTLNITMLLLLLEGRSF